MHGLFSGEEPRGDLELINSLTAERGHNIVECMRLFYHRDRIIWSLH